MDLSGMTEIQVEELFSQKNAKEQMMEELKEFMSVIKKEHYITLHNILDSGNDKRFTVDVMISLIAKLGNPKIGIKVEDGRQVDVNHMISVIAGIDHLIKRYDNVNRFRIAVEIIEQFDTILFDVKQQKKHDEVHGWSTETSVIIQFDVGVQAIKLEGLLRYRFPLIEKPIDWTEEERGGYHLEELREKVTTNKGAKKQPQRVLDVINILQSNRYRLRDVDLNEEFDYNFQKMSKKATTREEIEECKANVDVKMLTCYESYCAMNNLEFFFQWKFDCRGRMYSSGYDINLQADKYKKGMLQPVILSSIRRKQLEKELEELEC